MIRFAETKTIFLFAVICVDESTSAQRSDNPLFSSQPDAHGGSLNMTTTVLRLRLFHWNTMVATSEDCATKSIPCLDSDRMVAEMPIHQSFQRTTAITHDPNIFFVPRWSRRVKILYEVNEYPIRIGLGETFSGSSDATLNDGVRNYKDTLALARMMKKRWDVCCPLPMSEMPRPIKSSDQSADEKSNVVRFYLSRSEWNELYQELSQRNVDTEELQTQLMSTLTSSKSIGEIERSGVKTGGKSQLSGISYISIC